jgi:hypothetical protein
MVVAAMTASSELSSEMPCVSEMTERRRHDGRLQRRPDAPHERYAVRYERVEVHA